jgi:hypothetical protein
VTQPPPQFDIARQTTLQELQAAIAELDRKVALLMTQDADAAAKIADIETKMGLALTALGSIQDLFAALQTEVTAGVLSQTTLDALTKARDDADALAAAAQADVTADTPVPPVTPPAGP